MEGLDEQNKKDTSRLVTAGSQYHAGGTKGIGHNPGAITAHSLCAPEAAGPPLQLIYREQAVLQHWK